MKRLLLVAVLLLGAAAVAGVARPEGSHAAGAADTASPRTITVNGTGTATSTPARASLSFGVQTQGATAKAALGQNATDMRAVIAALQAAGAKDVQTESVSLSPVYGDNQDLRGFAASNSVSATVTYAAAGSTIDAAVAAGANQVSGPSPLLDDADALYRQALTAAVADARSHAEALAKAAGATLGQVESMSEGGTGPVPLTFDKAAAGDSTPVVPGSQATTASVSVTYSLA